MKKAFFLTFIPLCILLSAAFFILISLLVSCSDLSASSASSSASKGTASVSITSASETAYFEYTDDSTPDVFEITSDTASAVISGLSAGKTIYLTKTNPTSSVISASAFGCIPSASGLSLSSGDSSSVTAGSSSGTSQGGSGPHRCISLSLNGSLPQDDSTSARSASSLTKVTPVSYTSADAGTATRSVYVDQDEDISTFASETATLRAVGEYCYVWVLDDNWTSSEASGEKINSSIAEKIAENFDAMYCKIRNVFGEEADVLVTDTGISSTVRMSEYCETGTMVNIVVIDIGKDYKNGKNSGSTVGYFYAKDYFYIPNASSVYGYSNRGKYFYIDGYYAANSTATVFSTLAHEFQHMIDFGVKTIENGSVCSTSWNEMKSMLCEDIMFPTLSSLESDFDADDSPVSRLPMFNRRYAESGIEYRTTSPEVYYSYAANYAFGAWLIRNNGGISLLHEIAVNPYTDEKSVLKALSKITGSSSSMESLLKEYTEACVLNTDGSGFKKTPSDSELYLDGYTYSFEAIDLWNLDETLPDTYSECKDSTSYYKFDGQYLYGDSTQASLRPYGISLHKAGTTTAGEVTINFNT
ncbi:MAG: hypothetical protein J6Y93_05285, partial [Treponema sp.]|nr:hypothetical protein [Treponema sp.]